jgi:Na+/glutamate symporter
MKQPSTNSSSTTSTTSNTPNMSEATKATNKKHAKRSQKTPLIIYITIGLAAFIGYFVGELGWMGQPHYWHYLPIIPISVVGYMVGRLIYRLRGYQDII